MSLQYGDVVPLIDVATALGLRIGIITPGTTAGISRRNETALYFCSPDDRIVHP